MIETSSGIVGWLHGGAVSALRRSISISTLAFVLSTVVIAKTAEGSDLATASSFVQSFEKVCAEQVEKDQIFDKSHLVAASLDQRVKLQKALGFEALPDAVWAQEDGKWFQVQKQVSAPEVCEFFSFEFSLAQLRAAWLSQIQSGGRWRSEGMPYTRIWTSDDGRKTTLLSSGYSARPSEEGFFVSLLEAVEIEDWMMAHLIYGTTEKSSAGRDLWPEEC